MRRFAPLLIVLLTLAGGWALVAQLGAGKVTAKKVPLAPVWKAEPFGPPTLKDFRNDRAMPTFTAGTLENELFATGTTAGLAGANYQIFDPAATLVFNQAGYGINGDGWGMEQILSSEDPTYITVPADAVNGDYEARWYDDEFTTWRSAPFTVDGGTLGEIPHVAGANHVYIGPNHHNLTATAPDGAYVGGEFDTPQWQLRATWLSPTEEIVTSIPVDPGELTTIEDFFAVGIGRRGAAYIAWQAADIGEDYLVEGPRRAIDFLSAGADVWDLPPAFRWPINASGPIPDLPPALSGPTDTTAITVSFVAPAMPDDAYACAIARGMAPVDGEDIPTPAPVNPLGVEGNTFVAYPSPGDLLGWAAIGAYGVAYGALSAFTLADATSAPEAPVITIGGPSTASVAGIAFAGDWSSVDFVYWRVGYEGSPVTLAVTESAPLALSGLLQDQPYLGRFVAHGDAGDMSGPASPFTPTGGGVINPALPDVPGEIRLTRLRDTAAYLELPSLPANADSLQVTRDGATIFSGLAGGAAVVVLGLSELTDYVFRAVSANVFGLTPGPELLITTESTASQFVDPEEEDAADPVAAIVEPLDGATVAGIVRVRATGTDDIGVVAFRLYADSVLLATLAVPNWPNNDAATHYKFDYDVREVPNGTHVLRVEAEDAAGNIGSDSVTVTISNSLASQTKEYVSPEIAQATHPNFLSTGKELAKLWLTMWPAEVAENDGANFNWQPFLRFGAVDESPPGPVSLTDAQPLLNNKGTSVFGTSAEGFRVVILKTPRKVTASYALGGALRAVRLASYVTSSVAKVAVLTQAPNKLFSLAGTAATLVSDLSGLTKYLPVDVAVLNGLFYVAMQPVAGAAQPVFPHVRVIDPATGRDALAFAFDDTSLTITSLAAFGSQLWIGADDGLGNGQVWLYDGKSPDPSEAVLSGVARLYASGASAALAGTSDGKIYNVTANGGSLAHNTTEARVGALLTADGVSYAGTGDSGKLFSTRTGGAWALEQDFDFAAVRALTSHAGRVHLAGSNQIWDKPGGPWRQIETLADATTIFDLLDYNGALLIASDGDVPLRAREVPAVYPVGGVVAKTLMFVGVRAAYRIPTVEE